MPIYYYTCEDCGEQICHLRSSREAAGILSVPCPSCGGEASRAPAVSPSLRIVEVLDNGIMARRVEQYADAERLFKERAAIPKDRKWQGN